MARVTIMGQSGSGKSWFAGQKIESVLDVPEDSDDHFEYAVHCDLEDEERGLSVTTTDHEPLLKTFNCSREDLYRMVVVNEKNPPDYIPERELKDGYLVNLPKWVLYKNKYIRAVPDGLDDEERTILVEMMADAAMMVGDCHFSLDEAHLVARKHNIGPKLSRLVTGGRKYGVEWVFISQRPAKIHEDILAQANIGISFQLSSDRDLKKAEDSSEAFSAEDTLPSLGKRKAIVENFDTGEIAELDTNNLERKRPHIADDDGKSDEKWAKGTFEGDESDVEDVEMADDDEASA